MEGYLRSVYYGSARAGENNTLPQMRRTRHPDSARDTRDPEYVQDLERAGIDYELGGQMAFEESSEWRCRSCGHEWRQDESSILG